MKINQVVFKSKDEFLNKIHDMDFAGFDVHFLFSDKLFLEDLAIQQVIDVKFKNEVLMGCSTAGEISFKNFEEASLSITSVKFKNARVKKCAINLDETKDSFKAGEHLAQQLLEEDLKQVFVLSEGIHVNGTYLVDGLNSVLKNDINVSGGLAGDNAEFLKTYVADMNNQFVSNCISAIGIYGSDIHSGSGSYGGWDSFGIDRIVTKSKDNVVYEIDGKPALELYKFYLGDMSKDLPGSALFFPLEMRESEDSELLVRTILGINEAENSLTFAGNIPEGAFVRLMKTNVNRVIDAAEKAANLIDELIIDDAKLVLMVSCVGRKLVLKQLTQDEVEAVTSSFSDETVFAGFYSYGELSKLKGNHACNLHNQTMTLTAILES